MGIMDRVKKASETTEDHLKAFLWGPNGSGKSTLCGTAVAPILYAYTERQGVQAFKRMAPNEDTLRITGMSDLRELLGFLKKGKHSYATICLDSFTEMQLMLVDEVVARKQTDPDEPADLKIKDHMFIHDKSKTVIRAFRNLPMNVVITCLSDTAMVGDDNDRKRVTKVMLQGQKLPGQIGQFFNLVGYTYKAVRNGEPNFRVLFEGRTDIDTKGLPGLRMREEPDIRYWFDRVFGGAEPRDSEAKMIPMPEARQPDLGPSEEAESDGSDELEAKVEDTENEGNDDKVSDGKTASKGKAKKGGK